MPTAAKPPVTKAPAAATSKPKTAAVVKVAAGTATKTVVAVKKITPATPESKNPASAGRKRLSKAFPRPLDRKSDKEKLVRDRFTIPAHEYEQLVRLKKRLSSLGFAVRKSELVRAGLLLLAAMDDAKLKAATAKLSVARIDD